MDMATARMFIQSWKASEGKSTAIWTDLDEMLAMSIKDGKNPQVVKLPKCLVAIQHTELKFFKRKAVLEKKHIFQATGETFLERLKEKRKSENLPSRSEPATGPRTGKSIGATYDSLNRKILHPGTIQGLDDTDINTNHLNAGMSNHSSTVTVHIPG